MAFKSGNRTKRGRILLLLLALVIFGGACQQPLVQNPDFSTDFDLEPPGSSSLAGVAATADPQPTWTWTSGGNGIAYYRYRINGGAWQDTTDTSYTPDAPLPEGIYLFEVSERDDRGNWSEAAVFRTAIDLTPPDPVSLSVPGSPLLDANGDPVPDTVITGETQPLWSWDASGNGSGQFAIDSSGAGGSAPPLEGTGFPSRTYAGVPDTSYQPAAALGTGSHTVRVSERDEAGNWSDWVQFTVVIDLSIPTITLLDDSGTPGDNITNVNPPEFRVTTGTGPTVTDNYRWRVDGGGWTTISGASPVTFTPPLLSDGARTVEVQQQREDGSFSLSASVVVTIDTVAPNAPTVTTGEPNPTSNLRPTWNWISGGGGGAGVFQYDASGAGGALSGEVGVSSYTPASDLPNNDTYPLSVRERDVAGNWSNWATLGINVLNNPPVADAGADT
ncbi:MAG: Ig-like domain-containing protein, partial [Spirochaetaceae bacterium]